MRFQQGWENQQERADHDLVGSRQTFAGGRSEIVIASYLANSHQTIRNKSNLIHFNYFSYTNMRNLGDKEVRRLYIRYPDRYQFGSLTCSVNNCFIM